jgi:hypothetical protein
MKRMHGSSILIVGVSPEEKLQSRCEGLFCKAYGRSFPKVVKMCRILAFPRRQHVVDTFALQIS